MAYRVEFAARAARDPTSTSVLNTRWVPQVSLLRPGIPLVKAGTIPRTFTSENLETLYLEKNAAESRVAVHWYNGLEEALRRHLSSRSCHSSFLVKQLAVDVRPELFEEKGCCVNTNI
jgi:hypothetical protein